MKKILIVVGSGQIKGNTDALCQSFMDGALKAGHQVKKINLIHDIQGCKGCLACQKNNHHCVIKDEMQDYYELFNEADVIMLASPLYFWSISGRLKSFIDRLYAISTNDEYPQKETYLFMTSGSQGFYAFEQAVSYYHFLTQALNWHDRGQLLVRGCKAHERNIDEQYLKQAYEMGLHV